LFLAVDENIQIHESAAKVVRPRLASDLFVRAGNYFLARWVTVFAPPPDEVDSRPQSWTGKAEAPTNGPNPQTGPVISLLKFFNLYH
jgi:hypothetical protein